MIGVDLGTSNSSVGVYYKESVYIIKNDVGSTLTPSYVSFTEEMNVLIGDAAKYTQFSNVENTLFGIKRIIGRKFSEVEVQEDLKFFPFKVISD